MGLVRSAPSRHVCDLPSPNSYLMGTIATCDQCGRKWVLRRFGVTFKVWRPTILARLRRGKARQAWHSVRQTPQD